MTGLLELECGDDPEDWTRLGFAVEDGEVVRVGAVSVRLDGRGGGLRGWLLRDDGDAAQRADSLDGIPTRWDDAAPAGDRGVAGHPNGAIALDHVVVLTGDRDRTAAALVAAGGDERRRTGPPGVPVAMAFVRFGEAVVEVAEGGAPPRLWGLVAVVEDLDALAADLGPGLLGEPRAAVQPGRRIATVRESAGLGTALAFMTPRVRAGDG